MKNKTPALMLLMTLTLASCAQMTDDRANWHAHQFALGKAYAASGGTLPSLATRTNPVVTFENNQLVITPEFLYFGKQEGPTTITWRLPPDAGLRFDREKGVVIEGELLDQMVTVKDGKRAVLLGAQDVITGCRVLSDFEAACQNRNSRFMLFKYTVRIYKGQELIIRDPAGATGANM